MDCGRARRRRLHLVGLLAVVVVVVPGCAGPGGSATRCSEPPTADVETVHGWVGYLAAHPDDVAYLIDDGRGTRIEHRADAVHPMASASKALVLVAYAREVALGRVDPDEPVPVGEWERWSVLGNEESHARALDFLGIPRVGMRSADPTRTVTLDQIAHQTSIWSDDAGPDLLRARIGDPAMLETARDVGWEDVELVSNTGFLLSLYTPELVPSAADRPARRAAEWEIAKRYATDPVFRADVDTRPGPPPETESAWAAGGPGGSPRQLAALWSTIGRGTVTGADRARAITEQGPSPLPGVIARGAKGGLLSGIVTRGIHVRRDDGTVGVAVLLVRDAAEADIARLGEDSQAFADVLIAAVEDPQVTAAIACSA